MQHPRMPGPHLTAEMQHHAQSMPRIEPYILAGGRSSRMGRDKAMLSLGGRTLLARAVETLKAVPSLTPAQGKATVTLVGERTVLEGADRVIADRFPGCGPLGGIESALRDLERREAGQIGSAEWAFFIPVDMPFLSAGLIDALLREWVEAASRGARVCHVVVEETPQPLVSLVHRDLYPFVLEALNSGRYKVTPVLQSACVTLASYKQPGLPSTDSFLILTRFYGDGTASEMKDWVPTEDQEKARPYWFSNVNDEEEFAVAEQWFAALGSNG